MPEYEFQSLIPQKDMEIFVLWEASGYAVLQFKQANNYAGVALSPAQLNILLDKLNQLKFSGLIPDEQDVIAENEETK